MQFSGWRAIPRAFILVSMATALGACGGGGGGGGGAGEATIYTVSASATGSGSVSPASQPVDAGATATITVTPDSGYLISSVSGCDGTLSGNTYTTGAITADCTVSAVFSQTPSTTTHTVNATATGSGSVSPNAQQVNDGATATVTITPDAGQSVISVSGCDGTLAGNTYTTAAITADCTVSAVFSQVVATYTVSANATGNGSVSVSTQDVSEGEAAVITLTPDAGHAIVAVSGCAGTLDGNTYTTGAISADCTVSAAFTEAMTLGVASGNPKALTFTWDAVAGADHYKLLVDADGVSGLIQTGSDVTDTSIKITVPAHLTNWVNARYVVKAYDAADRAIAVSTETAITDLMLSSIGYFKASNAGEGDSFSRVALSGDGNTLAVGAPNEDTSTGGINRTPNEFATASGAVYVFRRNATTGAWSQQAFIKASNPNASDSFGATLALSEDGNTLAVAATSEDSSTTGINSTPDDAASSSGAVYVFRFGGSSWTQQAYVKAHNTGATDIFGVSLALSADGSTLAVGASLEDSSTTGIDSTADDAAADTGAAYLFRFNGSSWTQQAYIKSSDPENWDYFGSAVALSSDGNTLAVGAKGEDSSTTGVNTTPDNATSDSGAAYLFRFDGADWTQQAYIKPSNTGAFYHFGETIALGSDGDTLAVGAANEASATTGINSTPDSAAPGAGAAYIFRFDGSDWMQQAYVKASNTSANDTFANALALSGDGNVLAVGARMEDSGTTGVNPAGDAAADGSGAAYVFRFDGSNWTQAAFIKAIQVDAEDSFGHYSAIALDNDGSTLAVGAAYEDSSTTGVNSTPNEDFTNGEGSQGAVYLY